MEQTNEKYYKEINKMIIITSDITKNINETKKEIEKEIKKETNITIEINAIANYVIINYKLFNSSISKKYLISTFILEYMQHTSNFKNLCLKFILNEILNIIENEIIENNY